MKKIYMFFLLLFAAGCSPKPELLFDGSSFDGWRGYDRSDVPGAWSIEDGALKVNGARPGDTLRDGGDLIYAAKKFKNFELELEWKISKGGNSGIHYLGQEVKGEPLYISAPEYQVLDNENHPDAQYGIAGNRQAASLYDMIPAEPQNTLPYGQWNKTRIVVKDKHVAHYQNGKKVLEYRLGSPEWETLLNNSKFGSERWPEAFGLMIRCGEEPGYIGLQDHGDDVWFRNITVRELN